MGANSNAIYFAASLGDACATLQTIVNTAKEYGNCLTDKVYCTDYTTRCYIVGSLCRAYYYYAVCRTKPPMLNSVATKRTITLLSFIRKSTADLPAPIREYFKKIEDGNAGIDSAETKDAIDGVTMAADYVAKTAGKGIDYIYKARLITAAINICASIPNPADLDPADVYTGLRLVAIKLHKAVNNATYGFSLAVHNNVADSAWSVSDFFAKFLTMVAESRKARKLLFAFTGVDCEKTEVDRFDGDMEIIKVVDIISKATAAQDGYIVSRQAELGITVSGLTDDSVEQVKFGLCRALTILRKLEAELCTESPKQQESAADGIHSSGVIGNAMKE